MMQDLPSIAKGHRPAAPSATKRDGVITIKVKLGEEPIEENWDKSL